KTVTYTNCEQLQVNTLGGTDTVTVNNFTPGTTSLSVDGGTGTDSLVVNGTDGQDAITLAAGQVSVNSAPVTFSNVEQLQLSARDAPDKVTVTGLTQNVFTSVDGGGDADTLIVNGTAGKDTVALASGKVTVNGSGLTFTSFEQLQVFTFAGADTVTETGTNPG